MKVLCVDVGTGTQDILLFDSERELENCAQMVLPSPTQIVAGRIKRATARGQDVLLTGRIMGGGPCAWAAEDHAKKGYRIYATENAALTFDDELEKVERMGVRIVSDDAAARLEGVQRIEMRDYDHDLIVTTLASFDVDVALDAVAVAVFDHGNAPPGMSDRVFRFEYLAETVKQNDLTAFAYLRQNLPDRLTRMRSVAEDCPSDLPAVIMDTGPAAVLGALDDDVTRGTDHLLVANLGNFHTLAFHLAAGKILGLFEHHTGELTRAELETYLGQLAEGTISNAEVFADMGHGALVVGDSARKPDLLAVTGPRRSLLNGSHLNPYLAVPHGAMMLAGCYGLLRAVAVKLPEWGNAIAERLGGG